ncbi:MAG: hypothetical protein HC880_16975 [Bacteroidia bacterium]|nr:hypothetical protein [Bacteroidia bacterium]
MKKRNQKINAFSLSNQRQTLYLAGADGNIWQLDMRNPQAGPQPFYQHPHHQHTFTSLAISHNERLLSAGDEEGVLVIWDLNNNDTIKEMRIHQAPIQHIIFGKADTLMASASLDGTVRLWHLDTRHFTPAIFPAHAFDNSVRLSDSEDADWIWTVAFNDRQDFIWAGYRDGLIRRWAIRPRWLYDQLKKKIQRNMTLSEWNQYIGVSPAYEKTFEEY